MFKFEYNIKIIIKYNNNKNLFYIQFLVYNYLIIK